MTNTREEDCTNIVDDLKALIIKNQWECDFEEAIAEAHKLELPIIGGITTLDEYYKYLDGFIH